jgi:hypothetical protein
VIFINQLKLNAMTSSLVMQILTGAQYIKIKLPKCPFLRNLNLQPLAQNLNQLSLHRILSNQQKNEWINIFLHYEFAQNELEVRNKSLCDYLFVSQNQILIGIWKLRLICMKILSAASSHPERNPKSPSRT